MTLGGSHDHPAPDRSLAEAAAGSTAIADAVAQVASGAGVTTEGVAQNGEAIAELARMASELQGQVFRFRV